MIERRLRRFRRFSAVMSCHVSRCTSVVCVICTTCPIAHVLKCSTVCYIHALYCTVRTTKLIAGVFVCVCVGGGEGGGLTDTIGLGLYYSWVFCV